MPPTFGGVPLDQTAKPRFGGNAVVPVDPDISLGETITGALGQITQGLTLGFSDELIAGAEAAARSALFGEDFDTAFEGTVERVRQIDQGFAERNRASSIGLQIAGAAVPALATGGAAAPASLGGAVARGVGAGVVGGGAFGAGTAEGGPVERLPAALTGAAVGGATGGVAAPLIRGAVGAARGIGQSLSGNVANKQARRVVTERLAETGLTPKTAAQQVRAGQRAGTPARLADVGGEPITALVESVAKQPGRGQALVRGVLDRRQSFQAKRLAAQLRRGTRSSVRDVSAVLKDVTARRGAASKPLYDAAFAADIEQTAPHLVGMFDDLTAAGFGRTALRKAKQEFRTADLSKVPLMQRIDATKRAMDDMIGAALRKGEKNKARLVGDLKNEMLEAADAANPAYKLARDAWAGPTSYMSAIEQGRKILTPTTTPADLQGMLRGMSASEREGFRIGAVQRILDAFGDKGGELPDLTKVVNKPNIVAKLKALMSPEQGQQFETALKFEAQLANVANRARGGSRTSLLEAMRDVGGVSGSAADILMSMMQGRLGQALISTANIPGRLKNVLIERRNNQIAKILTSPDPAAAFRGAVPPEGKLSQAVPAALAATAGGNTAQPVGPPRTERR